MTCMSRAQRKLALSIAKAGPAAVPLILSRLSSESPDCIPLLLALGEIGAPAACPPLEKMAREFPPETEVGAYARKALTLSGSRFAADFAREAMRSSDRETVELGFWIVVQGHCIDLHSEVAHAALQLAEKNCVEGTAFLEASIAARSSATEHSWSDLSQTCRLVLSGKHSIWTYRPLVQSGLPEACALLLEFVIRLWRERRRMVNGIFYAIWTLAEEAVSRDQLEDLEEWARGADGIDDLSDALRAMSAEGDFGSALQVAARLRLPAFATMCSDALRSPDRCWHAVELAKLVPAGSTIEDLASLARPDDRGLSLAISCAEALAAQDSSVGFEALAEALRSWTGLPVELAHDFASRAVALDRITQCRNWLLDPDESKCLRQAAAMAVGLALYVGPEQGEAHGNVAALKAGLAEVGDVANAAAMACGVAGSPALLEPLKVAAADQTLAFEALAAISSIRTEAAAETLYQTWENSDFYFADGMPTTALAGALRGSFADPVQRTGPAWDRARSWLDRACKRFLRERDTRLQEGSAGERVHGDVSTDVAVSKALLILALDWGPSTWFIDQVESETRNDQTTSWMSTPAVGLRWRILARWRSDQLVDISRRYLTQPVSDTNKPNLVAALLEIRDPERHPTVREMILAMVDGAKAAVRRRIALQVARADPPWLGEIEVNDATAPLLRDIALFAGGAASGDIIGRLLSAQSNAIRRHGHGAQSARKRREAAAQVWDLFVGEASPFRRLWWASSYINLADEQALDSAAGAADFGLDLHKRFAFENMNAQARKRIEKEMRDEDWRTERDARPWVW